MNSEKTAPHLQQGKNAEDAAFEFLLSQGLQPRSRNFSCKFGEIDLIMLDGQTLVFIEVRHRNNRSHGSGAESITPAKRRRIIRTATYYLKSFANPPPCRFDVISSTGNARDFSIDWIKRAFEL